MRSVSAMVVVLGVALVVAGCSPAIDVQRFGPTYPSLAADCHVRLFRTAAHLDASCTRIGSVSFRDAGFTTNCGSDRVRREIRRKACEMGGQLAVLTRVPEVMSTCVETDAEIYRCEPEPAAPAEVGPGEPIPE